MDRWITARKGSTPLHLMYAHTFSNNVSADNTRVRTQQTLELRMDLNRNLRKRNKDTGMYLDARDLADGKMRQLSLVQIDDGLIIDSIRSCLGVDSPPEWLLTFELERDWRFVVRPEFQKSHALQSLFLTVTQPLGEDI